jgi:hypothetical protein
MISTFKIFDLRPHRDGQDAWILHALAMNQTHHRLARLFQLGGPSTACGNPSLLPCNCDSLGSMDNDAWVCLTSPFLGGNPLKLLVNSTQPAQSMSAQPGPIRPDLSQCDPSYSFSELVWIQRCKHEGAHTSIACNDVQLPLPQDRQHAQQKYSNVIESFDQNPEYPSLLSSLS